MGGLVKYCLRSSKADWASGVQWKLSCFFSSLKKGRPRTPSREMIQLRAAMHPVSFYMSWRQAGGPIFRMLVILGVGFDPAVGDKEPE